MTEELSESYEELVRFIIINVIEDLAEKIGDAATITQVAVSLVSPTGEKGTIVANLIGSEKGGTA